VAKQRKQKGFGGPEWSHAVMYQRWGLFNDYHVRYYTDRTAKDRPNGIITPQG
jgi:hypothetical protein